MKFGIWQIIMLSIIFINLGITLSRHGETHETKYNIFVQLIASTINFVILKMGGFF